MAACPLLGLPSELRIKIHEYTLAFDGPIKLREFVPGSDKTNLLRVNRQIYNEALPVLFDINTVAITRNDLCERTDATLKTPVPRKHIRHLLVSSFGESIACSFLRNRCSVCEDHAAGFFKAIESMPLLKTVVVDYQMHATKFRHFWQAHSQLHDDSVELRCTAVGRYDWHSARLANVDFTFQHFPLASVWPALNRLSLSLQSESEKETALTTIRKTYGDITDKLWVLLCAKKAGWSHEIAASVIGTWVDTWVEPVNVGTLTTESLSQKLHVFTQTLQNFTELVTTSWCRQQLTFRREFSLI